MTSTDTTKLSREQLVVKLAQAENTVAERGERLAALEAAIKKCLDTNSDPHGDDCAGHDRRELFVFNPEDCDCWVSDARKAALGEGGSDA